MFLHCWAIHNLKKVLAIPCHSTLLKSSQSGSFVDLYLVLLHCLAVPNNKTLRCVPCQNTLLKSSQSWNLADVQLVFIHCWAVPNLETMLAYTLSYYNPELLLILKHFRCVPCHNTLLKSSRSWNLDDVHRVLLHCWASPNLETMLT